MKRGAIKITHELLHKLLNLYDEIHIDEIVVSDKDRFSRTFHIIVSGDCRNMTKHFEGHEVVISLIEDFQKND